MKRVRIRVRGKGQVTIPVEVRRAWGLREGDELVLAYDEQGGFIRPRRRTRVRECAGALGKPADDEVGYAVLDPELLPLYYAEKYGGSRGKAP